MPRLPQKNEVSIRERVKEFIQTEAVQTDKITYYSPSAVKRQLERRGISVPVAYILRRYGELGIKCHDGLYYKDAV